MLDDRNKERDRDRDPRESLQVNERQIKAKRERGRQCYWIIGINGRTINKGLFLLFTLTRAPLSYGVCRH